MDIGVRLIHTLLPTLSLRLILSRVRHYWFIVMFEVNTWNPRLQMGDSLLYCLNFHYRDAHDARHDGAGGLQDPMMPVNSVGVVVQCSQLDRTHHERNIFLVLPT